MSWFGLVGLSGALINKSLIDGKKNMKTTALKFKKNPQGVYRHADLGGTVEIHHERYPDRVFMLTAKAKVMNPVIRESMQKAIDDGVID